MKKSIDSAKHLALLGLGRSRINNLALPLLAMLLVVGALALFTTDGAVQAADPPTASSPLVVTNVEGGSECNSGATGLPSTSTLSVGGSDNKFKGGTPATDDPPWAIWANANEDPKEETLDIPGSHQVIHGLVQSRGHLKMGGSWNQLKNGTIYGDGFGTGKPPMDLSGSNNCFTPIPGHLPGQDAPPAPGGFPFNEQFDDNGFMGKGDGAILEHFMPGGSFGFTHVDFFGAGSTTPNSYQLNKSG